MIKLFTLLLERMSLEDADTIFANNGVPNAAELSPEELKSHYKQLVLKHHPDKGGDVKKMQFINAAYDVLKEPHEPLSKSSDISDPTQPSANRTYPKDPKTKGMYTTKFDIEFRSVLNGRSLFKGKCDQIDFVAIINKLKQNRVYTEIEGNTIYVDVAGFNRVLPDLQRFFTS